MSMVVMNPTFLKQLEIVVEQTACHETLVICIACVTFGFSSLFLSMAAFGFQYLACIE